MLNIEVIRFEAQDVITASVAAPVEPCTCDLAGNCMVVNGENTGLSHIANSGNGYSRCPGNSEGKHTCGN